MSLRNLKTIDERRAFIEKTGKMRFSAASEYPDGLREAQIRNCENMIGATSVPLGIAGPLRLKGDYVDGDYFIPLATTEGALVASVNRGCKAITLAGGATVMVEEAGITRGPVFETGGIRQGRALCGWVSKNMTALKEAAEATSSHLKLKHVNPQAVGTYVFIRFSFDTQDAMGMNMVTVATEKMVRHIETETGVRCLSLAGNVDGDKKPTWSNMVSGRGKRVWAEIILPDQLVRDVLKTSPDAIHRICSAKCHIGSIISGSLGFNAHFANMIAALYLATGQDMAHVVEGSLGITTTESSNNRLSMAVYLPDVVIGTVGGGTGLPSQMESLELLGVAGGDGGKNALRLGEIVGGAVLAGELSLLASLAEGTLAKAHERLARGK